MCFTKYSLFVSSLKAESCQGNTKEYEIKEKKLNGDILRHLLRKQIRIN